LITYTSCSILLSILAISGGLYWIIDKSMNEKVDYCILNYFKTNRSSLLNFYNVSLNRNHTFESQQEAKQCVLIVNITKTVAIKKINELKHFDSCQKKRLKFWVDRTVLADYLRDHQRDDEGNRIEQNMTAQLKACRKKISVPIS